MQTTFPTSIIVRHFYCSQLVDLFNHHYHQDEFIDPRNTIDDLNQRIGLVLESYAFMDEETQLEEIDFLESSVTEYLFDLMNLIIDFYRDWFNYWVQLNMVMKFRILDDDGTFVMSFHPYK